MRLCPNCEKNIMIEDYIKFSFGEEFIRYECWDCGYSYMEVINDDMEDWAKNDYDLIEGDDGG